MRIYDIILFLIFKILFLVIFFYFKFQKKINLFKIEYTKKKLEESLIKIDILKKEKDAILEELNTLYLKVDSEKIFNNKKLELYNEFSSDLINQLKTLSLKSLYENNKIFLNLAKESFLAFKTNAQENLTTEQQSISSLIQPLTETLKEFKEQSRIVEQKQIVSFNVFEEQLKNVSKSHLKLELETRNLIQALKVPHVRGQWGELQLKRSVEIAGMIEHVDFNQQKNHYNNEKIQRPDMVINLPNNRKIVIDAKTPLFSYLQGIEAISVNEQKVFFKKHVQNIKDHIQILASKQYWKQFEESPDFVILFLPGESIFSTALQNDSQLLEQSFKDNVIISTPTTLIALLKTIAAGWREKKIASETKKISELGQILYERIIVFVKHFEDLRKNLDKSIDSYNKTVSSLEYRVLPAASKLKELHIKTNENIPLSKTIDNLVKKIY